MMQKVSLKGIIAALVMSCVGAWSESIKGVVKDASGTPLRGVMVSAISGNFDKSISVLSAADGSFKIDDLSKRTYDVRGRKDRS